MAEKIYILTLNYSEFDENRISLQCYPIITESRG